MSRKFVFLFFLVIVLFPAFSKAQGLGNSPYSQIGIGDLVAPVSVQNLGAGGISVSQYNRDYVQLSNPATSVNKKGLYNDSLIKFEASGTAQYKVLSVGNKLETYTAANFRYFALTVPIGKVWNTTVSMQPFSVKDHSYSTTTPIQGDPAQGNMQYTYEGKGGLYQIALNNGWGVSKTLSVGLGLNYLFGPATTTNTSVMESNSSGIQYGTRTRINHKGLGIKPAAHYRKEFYVWKDSVLVPSGIFWNAGATVQVFAPMQLTSNQYKISRNSAGTISEDSLIVSSTQTTNLPAQFTFGMSIDKPNRWMIGVEGGFSNWSGYEYGNFADDTYRLAWNLGIGGEFRPVTRKQWKSPTYRAGFNFAILPYVVDGNQLNDVSGSLGLTLPVGVRGASGATFPKINLAVVVGQRGTISTENTQELYVRMHVSILITDKWFIKRRIQ
ncbi:MAG: hypothetical protein K0R51_238 [Cytophagaceae bacterium]|jgi:hypothetical protein|nr:hypothetical protein [Cytophagaceae bacterium]